MVRELNCFVSAPGVSGASRRLLMLTLLLIGALSDTSWAQSTEPSATAEATSWSQLADDATAAALGLSEAQREQIATILTERDTALDGASDEDANGIRAAADAELAGVLTDEQRAQFRELSEEPRLKFNFRFQKWADVLDWMADEADLSLVMDEPPPGTFNYSDSKEYTPTEAIDLLNGWLLTKGFTLVRRERLLMCLNLKDGLPEGAIPRVTGEELDQRGRFEFVSILIPLEGRPADVALSEITPLLGTWGKAEVLSATQQLLVADAAANVRLIHEVVQQVPVPRKPDPPQPKPPAPKPELIVYPIEHANPERAGEVLKMMIDGSLLVDDAAGQISINAVPGEHAKAKTIIEQLEANQGPDKQPMLQLYPARIADPTELLATLDLIIPEGQFRYDAGSRRLVAWARPADQTRVASAISELLAEQSAAGATQLEVYPLQDIAPETAQSLISSLLPEARITADTKTNSLIAVGTLSDQQAIRDLLTQLEPRLAATAPEELRSYPLEDGVSDMATQILSSVVPDATVTVDAENQRLLVVADPERQSRVETALTRLKENLARPDRTLRSYDAEDADVTSVTALLQTLAPDAQVTSDTSGERLLVIASAEDHATVDNVLQQAGADAGQQDRELRSYPLAAETSSETAVSLLSTLTPDAGVTVDEPGRRLLITARPQEHTVIAGALEQIAKDARGEIPQLRFYPLKDASGPNAVTVLSTMLPSATISFDEVARRLSVVASQRDHEVVAATLEQLEASAPPDEKRTLEIHEVTVRQKARFTALIDSLSAELPGLELIADAHPDEVTVWARPSQQAVVRDILRQLERDVPPEERPQLVVYPIRKTDAAGVSSVLTELFPDAQITVDEVASRLMIHARPALQETIRAAIEQLDSEVPAEKEIRLMVYPVSGIDATAAIGLISTELPEATVIHDTTAETLIVRGNLQQQEQVAELLESLRAESTPLQTRTVVRYPLTFGNATELTAFFEASFPDASFVADPTTRSLTAFATAEEHLAIRDAVGSMSESGAGKTSLQQYRLSDRDLTGVAELLATAVPEAEVVLRNDTLLTWAAETDHAVIRSVVDGLREAPADRRVAAFDISRLTPTDAQTFLGQAVPEVTFQVSADGQALIALVDESQETRIREMLTELSVSPAASAARTLRIYDLEAAGGAPAQAALTTAVPTVTFTPTSDGRRMLAVVDDEQHKAIESTLARLAEEQPFADKPELRFYSVRDAGPSASTVITQSVPGVSISSGARPGQIAVVASQQQHERVAKLLEQLNAAATDADEPVLSVHDIRGTDPAAVQSVLQALVEGDVSITADAAGRRLYVRGTPQQQDVVKRWIDQITRDGRVDDQLLTRTYFVGAPDADEAQEVLLALYPDATIVTDADRKLIVATATPEQHTMIEQITSQISGASNPENAPFPVVYGLDNIDADTAEDLVSDLFTRSDAVRLAVNDRTGRLIAVARAEQHKVIDDVLQQFDGDAAEDSAQELAAYRVVPLEADTVQSALEPLLPRDVTITVGDNGREILVTATAEQQQRVARLVKQLTTTRQDGAGVQTKSYRLIRGDADAAQSALQALFPDATLVTDRRERVLVATASESQHVTIRTVVEELNGGVGADNQPEPRTYRLNQADGATVQEVLANLFEDQEDVRLSLDESSQAVVAIARPEQHRLIEATLKDLDPSEGAGVLTSRLYALDGLNQEDVRDVVEDLLQERNPGSTVHAESVTGNLLVTTNEAGHRQVREIIDEFGRPEERRVEVFQLTYLEPFAAQSAIEQMISSQVVQEQNRPVIHTDADMQQVWVQATEAQIADMRTLLQKMGEPGLGEAGARRSNRTLRVIPVGADVESTVQQIRELWPQLRPNPLRLVSPPANGQPVRPGAGPLPGRLDGRQQRPGQFSLPPDAPNRGPSDATDQTADSPATGTAAGSSSRPDALAPPAADVASDQGTSPPESRSDAATATPQTAPDGLTETSGQPPADRPPDLPEEPDPAGQDNALTESSDDRPPVVLVPGNGRLTIASDDTEALDQLEALVRAINSVPVGGRNRDFSIYQLTNAGASDVATTLQQIFDDPAGLLSFGQVVMVPDDRLNALIVFASRTDRGRIEQLLEVLDSEKLEDTQRAFRTEVVPLRYAAAARVADVIEGVYRVEMTAGGARSAINIPKGVPSEVAAVLRQINAAASSPLLTVEVQVETNSLVIKAPLSLLEEVQALVERLDEASRTSRARGVRLYPLQKTNTRRVMEILDDVLD